MCIDIVLPGLVNKEGAYRAAPELSRILVLPFYSHQKMRIAPGSRACLGKWAWPLSMGCCCLVPWCHWGGWGPSPWLALQMSSTEIICHEVIPKSSRMHQAWPELGGSIVLLCQATGNVCVSSKRWKSNFFLGHWWLGSWMGPLVLLFVFQVCSSRGGCR